MNKTKLSPEALEARREYYRKYYRANRDRKREANARYWMRKAARADGEKKEARTDE